MAVQMQPSDLTRADQDEMRKSIDRWVELSLDRDFERLADELMTEDVTLLPPDHPVCEGRTAALAYLNGYPEIEKFKAATVQIHGRGDTAIVRGTFDITVMIEGDAVRSVGKWLAGYRKTPMGWRVSHDTWNNDAPIG